jgi:hypothetical protein
VSTLFGVFAGLALAADLVTTQHGLRRGWRERFPGGLRAVFVLAVAGLIAAWCMAAGRVTPGLVPVGRVMLVLIAVAHAGAAWRNRQVMVRRPTR